MSLLLSEIVLFPGGHYDGETGACLMEWVALFAGEERKHAYPPCTNEFITAAAITLNDSLRDPERQSLVPLIPRLLRAKRTTADQRVNVRLAIWQARSVLKTEYLSEWEVAEAQELIDLAERWLQDETTGSLELFDANTDGEIAQLVAGQGFHEPAVWLSDLLDAHEKAMAEEGVLWEDEFCAFADGHSG